MKKSSFEWINEFHEKYYHLFETYDGEESSNSYYKKGDILRGIECGDGWKDPVERFLQYIDFCQRNNCRDGDSIKIFQIKEKFGDVRAYVKYPERLSFLIERYIGRLEGECYLTCENCGSLHKNGITKTNGWLYCICDNCKK